MCLAIPGKILSIHGDDQLTRMARVSFAGVVKEVCLAYLPEAACDDYVIVHAGFALSRVDEAEAQTVFEYLALLGPGDATPPAPAGAGSAGEASEQDARGRGSKGAGAPGKQEP